MSEDNWDQEEETVETKTDAKVSTSDDPAPYAEYSCPSCGKRVFDDEKHLVHNVNDSSMHTCLTQSDRHRA